MRPTSRPRTSRPRTPRAPRWTLIQSTPDDWGIPCWTLAQGATLVYVGPAQGPAAHIHEATARRALAQLNTPRHTH